MIIQNQWQTDFPELLPVSERADGAVLYAFNVSTEESRKAVRDIARTWAHRYASEVSNWVIGNEIKAANPDARVFIPFDHRFNWPGGNGAGYYQAQALAAAYEAAKANPYVEGFFLNREIDLPGGEMGFNFGLIGPDGVTRKQAYETYKNLQ